MVVTVPEFCTPTMAVYLDLSVPLVDDDGTEVAFVYHGDSVSVHPERWEAFREQFPALAESAEAQA